MSATSYPWWTRLRHRHPTNCSQETRIRQVEEPYGGHYGHSRYGADYGLRGSAPRVRSYAEEVMVAHIELFDGQDGQRVWSGSAEALAAGRQGERAAALRTALRQALSTYPPD